MKSYALILATCLGLVACGDKNKPAEEPVSPSEQAPKIEQPAKRISYDEASIKGFIDTLYKDYDQERQCWITKTERHADLYYCMKIAHKQTALWNEATGEQSVYLVLSSELLDEDGKPFASRVDSGLVSFVHIAADEVMFADLDIHMGVFGQPPETWALKTLSANDYRGWQTEVGQCHMGHCISYYALYAPIQDKATLIADFPIAYDNGGTLASEQGQNKTLDAEVLIDEKADTSGLYPLIVTVSGTEGDKAIPESTWTIEYDDEKSVYVVPKSWVFSEVAP